MSTDPHAAPPGAATDPAADAPSSTLLTFVLGSQVLAVPVTHVREIVDRSEIAPLPNAPHDVLGLIDLRGRSVPVIDLAARLGLCATPGDEARIVVFALADGAARPAAGPAGGQVGDADADGGGGAGGGGFTCLGVLTERVLRVIELPHDALEDMPDTLSGWRCDAAACLARTEDGRALVLDVDRLLRRDAAPGPFDFH